MNPKLLAIDIRAAGSANVRPALAESSSNSKQKRPSAIVLDDISSQSSLTNNQISKFNKTLLSVQSYSAQSPDSANYSLSENVVIQITPRGQDKTNFEAKSPSFLSISFVNPAQSLVNNQPAITNFASLQNNPAKIEILTQEQQQQKPLSALTPLINMSSRSKLPTASLPPNSDITKPVVSMPDTAKTENRPFITGIDLAQTKAAAPIISAGIVETPEAAMLSTPDKADVPVPKPPMPPTPAVSPDQEKSFSASDKLTGDKDVTNHKGQDKAKLEANHPGFLPVSSHNPAQPLARKAKTVANVVSLEPNSARIEDSPQQQIDPKPPSEPTWLIDTFPGPNLPTDSLPPSSDITKPAISMPDTAKTEDKPLITGIDLAQTKAAAPIIPAGSVEPPEAAMVSTPDKADVPAQKPPMPPQAANSNGPKIPTIDSDLPITQLSSSQQTQAVSSNQETSFSASDKLTGDKAATNNKDKIIPELTDGNAGKNVGDLPTVGYPTWYPTSDFLSHKTTVAESQILTRQPKSQNSSVANENFNANFEQMFSHNAAQIAVAQKSSILAETDKPVNNFYFSDASSDVAKQILESIYSSFSTDSKQITIRLNPPELGKVFIRFRQEDTSITGLLEVDKTQTKYQIEQALPQIIQNLQDSGIQIKRLEVALAQQDQQDPLPDQSTHQDWFQQHSFPGYDTSGSGKSVNLFLTNADNSQDNPTYPVQVTGDSINILV